MENQELDIRILRFLSGELTTSELTSFEERLSLDVALKQKVAEYKKLEAGVKKYGKDQMIADLLVAQTTVIKAKALENYKPSINGGSGFNVFTFIAKLLVIGTIVSGVLIYMNKLPIKHEFINTVHNKMHSFDSVFETKYDTVWHIVPSSEVELGDTVYIKSKQYIEQIENDYK